MIEIEGSNVKWEDDEFDMGYELEVGGMENKYLEGDGRVLSGDDLERETGRVVWVMKTFVVQDGEGVEWVVEANEKGVLKEGDMHGQERWRLTWPFLAMQGWRAFERGMGTWCGVERERWWGICEGLER